MKITGQIEALLFVAGDEGVSLDELASLIDEPTATIFKGIEELKASHLDNDASALHILEVGNHFILTTKKDYAELIKDYAQSPLSNSLSQSALEVLSIIAYKQPITRMQVDEIRGVQSSSAVQKLVARQLIEEKSRVDGPGRAILYGTTEYFMNYFGLENMTDLPSIEEMEDEIEKEIPSDLFFDNFKEDLDGLENKTENADESDSSVEETN
ncbi:SMC-Scp complex subunit ScpB [Vagococcus coleopterorum]|uniref:Segregation and condensation protein B n=1 Tax=Vagococcus coleopterorum TaxID=2714946 RepID=A0A6G8ANM7_9ENTE|nr:SMC-Scp complex subunit ScpB [Vagococcus coleopterorum]QIL46597.1 SMC-Scp complex subunit ScpB [Vagococcus coleopterorum]